MKSTKNTLLKFFALLMFADVFYQAFQMYNAGVMSLASAGDIIKTFTLGSFTLMLVKLLNNNDRLNALIQNRQSN
ncbi:hypothetical protein PsAD37_02819 [Pseudovibrio sp. Ad37]|nr:hypothetical protein PsAD37_02819 [Pseudovibrio sp. Ad37]